jgi:hypothetical protein
MENHGIRVQYLAQIFLLPTAFSHLWAQPSFLFYENLKFFPRGKAVSMKKLKHPLDRSLGALQSLIFTLWGGQKP